MTETPSNSFSLRSSSMAGWLIALLYVAQGPEDAFAPLQQLQVARNNREQIIELVSADCTMSCAIC
jgi:hypothetical protein